MRGERVLFCCVMCVLSCNFLLARMFKRDWMKHTVLYV